jgi:hypothetical protein
MIDYNRCAISDFDSGKRPYDKRLDDKNVHTEYFSKLTVLGNPDITEDTLIYLAYTEKDSRIYTILESHPRLTEDVLYIAFMHVSMSINRTSIDISDEMLLKMYTTAKHYSGKIDVLRYRKVTREILNLALVDESERVRHVAERELSRRKGSRINGECNHHRHHRRNNRNPEEE